MTIILEESPYDSNQPRHVSVPMFQHQLRVLYAAQRIEEIGYVPLSKEEKLLTNVGFICCPPGASEYLF